MNNSLYPALAWVSLGRSVLWLCFTVTYEIFWHTTAPFM